MSHVSHLNFCQFLKIKRKSNIGVFSLGVARFVIWLLLQHFPFINTTNVRKSNEELCFKKLFSFLKSQLWNLNGSNGVEISYFTGRLATQRVYARTFRRDIWQPGKSRRRRKNISGTISQPNDVPFLCAIFCTKFPKTERIFSAGKKVCATKTNCKKNLSSMFACNFPLWKVGRFLATLLKSYSLTQQTALNMNKRSFSNTQENEIFC